MVGKNKRSVNWARSTLPVVAMMLTLSTTFAHAQTSSVGTTHWEGQEVFREKGCIQCHSIYGRNGKDGPDLGKRKFYGTYLELATRMWNHFPKMYKKMQETDFEFQKMSEEEMGQLIIYLSFIRYIGEPGRDYKGRELIEKSCMKCHPFGGRGGNIGPDFIDDNKYITSIRLVEAMWNHGPYMMHVFEETDIKRPTFKGNDVAHILAGIRSYMPDARISTGTFVVGDPPTGERLFTDRGCAQCHSVSGVGGTLGPDFADIDLEYSATQIAGKMWNHGPKMWEIIQRENITFPAFEEGEMVHVVAYLYSLKLKDPPGNPNKGERIVHDEGCLNCHALRGVGAKVSVDLAAIEPVESPLAIIAGMWNHAPGMREKQLEKNLRWPKLEADEMADLYAYLHALTQPTNENE